MGFLPEVHRSKARVTVRILLWMRRAEEWRYRPRLAGAFIAMFAPDELIITPAIQNRPWQRADDLFAGACQRLGLHVEEIPLPWKRCYERHVATRHFAEVVETYRPEKVVIGLNSQFYPPDIRWALRTALRCRRAGVPFCHALPNDDHTELRQYDSAALQLAAESLRRYHASALDKWRAVGCAAL